MQSARIILMTINLADTKASATGRKLPLRIPPLEGEGTSEAGGGVGFRRRNASFGATTPPPPAAVPLPLRGRNWAQAAAPKKLPSCRTFISIHHARTGRCGRTGGPRNEFRVTVVDGRVAATSTYPPPVRQPNNDAKRKARPATRRTGLLLSQTNVRAISPAPAPRPRRGPRRWRRALRSGRTSPRSRRCRGLPRTPAP